MKPFAEFKREATKGNLWAEMTLFQGSPDIPARITGVRRICAVSTVDFKLENKDGAKSSMSFPPAALVEYDGNELRIFNPAERPLNEQEAAVMAEWKKIADTEEFQERQTLDALTDGSSTFWREKIWFEKSACPWLFGAGEVVSGYRYNPGKKLVTDYHIKGNLAFVYKLTRKH